MAVITAVLASILTAILEPLVERTFLRTYFRFFRKEPRIIRLERVVPVLVNDDTLQQRILEFVSLLRYQPVETRTENGMEYQAYTRANPKPPYAPVDQWATTLELMFQPSQVNALIQVDVTLQTVTRTERRYWETAADTFVNSVHNGMTNGQPLERLARRVKQHNLIFGGFFIIFLFFSWAGVARWTNPMAPLALCGFSCLGVFATLFIGWFLMLGLMRLLRI